MTRKILVSLLKSILLILSIPVLYKLSYFLFSCMHEPNDRHDGMDFYGLTLEMLTWFILLTLPALVLICDFLLKNLVAGILLHLLWFLYVLYMTIGDLHYRPYDFGLVLACVIATIPIRLLLNYVFSKRN